MDSGFGMIHEERDGAASSDSDHDSRRAKHAPQRRAPVAQPRAAPLSAPVAQPRAVPLSVPVMQPRAAPLKQTRAPARAPAPVAPPPNMDESDFDGSGSGTESESESDREEAAVRVAPVAQLYAAQRQQAPVPRAAPAAASRKHLSAPSKPQTPDWARDASQQRAHRDLILQQQQMPTPDARPKKASQPQPQPAKPVDSASGRRAQYALEQRIGAFETEFRALQSTVGGTVTALQREVEALRAQVEQLDAQLALRRADPGVTEEVREILQDLKNTSRWFWGRVLPHPKGRACHVELYRALPDDASAAGTTAGAAAEVLTVPSGKWLKLAYPMRQCADASGHEYVWIRTESINPRSAQITTYWAKSYDVARKRQLIGDFRFRHGADTVADAAHISHTEPPGDIDRAALRTMLAFSGEPHADALAPLVDLSLHSPPSPRQDPLVQALLVPSAVPDS